MNCFSLFSRKAPLAYAGVFLLVVSIAIALIDLAAKYGVRANDLPFLCNPGVAFGLPISAWLIPFLFLIFILALIHIYARQRPTDFFAPFFFPFILIAIGACANLLDRFLFGCVTDYMRVGALFHFNGADLLIVGGAIMIVLRSLRSRTKGIASFS